MTAQDNDYKDLLLLIEHLLLMGNSMKGKTIPKEERIRFVEPLGKKTLAHIISAVSLYNGTKFILSDKSYTHSVDFSSIAVLTRAAIESYLTFNYVMTNPEDKEEKEFRFYCWDLAGFIERENYPASNDKAIKLKASEKELKNKRIKDLENNKVFQNLSAGHKKLVLKGNWRIGKSWTDLSAHAAIPKETFKHIYSYLCSYSHSGRLSIIQIEQTKGLENEKQFGKVFQSINLIILARLIVDYVYLLPDCKATFESNKDVMDKVYIWNKIGDRLEITHTNNKYKQ